MTQIGLKSFVGITNPILNRGKLKFKAQCVGGHKEYAFTGTFASWVDVCDLEGRGGVIRQV